MFVSIVLRHIWDRDVSMHDDDIFLGAPMPSLMYDVMPMTKRRESIVAMRHAGFSIARCKVVCG